MTKNRFEPLPPSENFYTENDRDLMEELNCSSSKQESDSTETDIVPSTGHLPALNQETRSNHDSTHGQKVPKNLLQSSIMDDKYDLALQLKIETRKN